MQRVDGNSLPTFRDSISIPSSRVKNPRTAQFLPTLRRKPKILVSCASGRRTEKQIVGSFVQKPSAVLPRTLPTHKLLRNTVYHNTIFFIYAYDSYNLHSSIHPHDTHDIRNLPISYVMIYTRSFRYFVKKKKKRWGGGNPYNFKEKQEGS